MAPAADTDERLLMLQIAVSEARTKHEDLVQRRDLMERTKHYASAQALRIRADRAFLDLRNASRKLASYLSERARR